MIGVNGWSVIGSQTWTVTNGQSHSAPNAARATGTLPGALVQALDIDATSGYVSAWMRGEDQNAGLYFFQQGGGVNVPPSSFGFNYTGGADTIQILSLGTCSWSAVDISNTAHWSQVETYWSYNGTSYTIEPVVEGVSQGTKSGCVASSGPFNAVGFGVNFDTFSPEYWFDDFELNAAGVLEYQFGFNTAYETRFTDIDFSGTSTINIAAQYYLDEDEVDTSTSLYNPTAVRYQYALQPGTTLTGRSESIDPGDFGTSTATTSISGLPDGTYDLLVSFSNGGCAIGVSDCPFPFAYVYTEFTVSGGVLTATGTPEFYDQTNPLSEVTEQPCSLTELDGCIANAFSFLFVPSVSSLDGFTALNESLETKFPFAYAYDVSDQYDALFSTALATSTTISIPFGTFGNITLLSEAMLEAVPFASVIRSILAALLWVMLMANVYRRTLKIFNPAPL